MKQALLTMTLACFAAAVGAEPVKCVDANGKVRYVDSSTPGTENCKPVTAETNVVRPQSGSGAVSSSPARAGPSQGEAGLRAAQNDLETAKRQLAEQEAIRNGDEKNYQRVLDRLKPYQDAVERAQQNLDRVQRDSR
jgi:hypothetical protein